ncbi:MAG TPA: NAD(P)-binding domain-containing protein [Enteractinococcus sp.]
MSSFDHYIGVLGAGRAGTAIARAAARHGIDVQIASTRTPSQMRYHLMQYAPVAHGVHAKDIACDAEIIILAIPQQDLDDVDPNWIGSRILVDATNRWDEEPLPDWFTSGLLANLSSSEIIAQRFPNARVVKALNHISHWAMDAPRSDQRRGALVASDDQHAAQYVAQLVAALGFDPVVAPSLALGRVIEPGSSLFNVAATAQELQQLVSPHDTDIPE